MKTITTRDRIEMNHGELLNLLVKHIEEQTGRKVDGKPHISAQMRDITGSEYAVSAHLKPKEEK